MRTKANESVRLNRYLAECGLASRRHADQMIAEGQVIINGKRVFELGIKINPREDKVVVKGKPIKAKTQRVCLAFHKPKGVLSTLNDPLNRPSIKDFFENFPERLFPVGRLDWDSEGLILMTNDGDLSHEITHPTSEVTKTYLVKVDGQPSQEHLQKLLRGVSIIGGKAKAKYVSRIRRPSGSDKYDWVKIIITEGRNRQIRLMFEKIGFDVLKLQRISIGRYKLGKIKRGEAVFLDDADVNKIFLADDPEELADVKSYKGHRQARAAAVAKTQAESLDATEAVISGSTRAAPRKDGSKHPARSGNKHPARSGTNGQRRTHTQRAYSKRK